jgi:anaerobic selenocysteine-containing dehydrogenase
VNPIDAINKQIMIEQTISCSSIGSIPQVDFYGTDVLLIIGANPVVSHGHLAGMLFPRKRLRDIKKRGGKVIVADPRLTKTAKVASISIQPRPGTDYAWLGYVICELLVDENNSEGIDWRYLTDDTHGVYGLRQIVSHFDEIAIARITGLSSDSLH